MQIEKETLNNSAFDNSNLKIKQKKKVIVLVSISLLLVALIAFSIIFILHLIPNKSSDLEFIEHASKIVSLDSKEYKKAIKSDKMLTNLDKVFLWEQKGQAYYKLDKYNSYVTDLCWKCDDLNSFDLLYQKINKLYGDDSYDDSYDDKKWGNKWEISKYNDNYKGNQNIAYVQIIKSNEDIVIIWKTANEAYLINERIDSIREITIESKSELDEIKYQYENLSPSYIKYVKSYKKLMGYYSEYYSLYVKYFDKTATEIQLENSSENYDTAEKLLKEYDELGENYKKLIKNYDLVKKALNNCKTAKHTAIIKELNDITNDFSYYDISTVKMYLRNYMQLFTESEIKNYLPYALYDDAISKAEEYLKLFLKEPSSYVKYSNAVGKCAIGKKDIYFIDVTLIYGARNSFNAMVQGKKKIFVYYKVKDNEINYQKAEFSAYDQWQIARNTSIN